MNFDKSRWFLKKSVRLFISKSKILAFGSHSLANFQPILDFFIPNFKLMCGDSDNINASRVNTVVFNLYQINCLALFFFLGDPVVLPTLEDSFRLLFLNGLL